MKYELDDLDRDLLAKCRAVVLSQDWTALDEDDWREAVELLVKVTTTAQPPVWPHRCTYLPDLGYVVWRDVFEGQMECSIDVAVRAHKVAVFVCGSEAAEYCEHRNVQTQPAPTAAQE